MTTMAEALDVIEKALAAMFAPYDVKARSITREYANSVTDLVERTTSGRITARRMASGHNTLIDEYAERAFVEGMEECGIDDAESELDTEDRDIIDTWRDAQKDYTSEYAKACQDARGDENAIDAVLERVTLWERALESLKGHGCISAKENTVGIFRLGSTKEHCDTCRGLNGKRKRMKEWRKSGLLPQEPGNTNFDCQCFKCECHIDDAKGNQLYP